VINEAHNKLGLVNLMRAEPVFQEYFVQKDEESDSHGGDISQLITSHPD